MQDRLQDSLVSLQAGRFFDDHPILRRAGETPTAPSLLSVFRELGLFVPEGETQAQDDTRPSLLGPLASVPAEIQDLAEHLFAQDLHEYTHVLRIDEHAVRIVLERCLASAQTADDPGRHRHRHQHRPRSDGTACCSDAAVAIDETCATASPNRSTAAAWIVRGDCCFGVSAGCSDDDQASRTRAILRGTGVSIEEARRQLQAELLQSQA
ncbi:uncharacterized protein BJ171DRAFT_497198 [Polychytrium aggregatum]|uniref:uncharacterized protein n=1 Tax=Polychytrium aggregatum TaxID=110093 RepID=UPI0022FE7CE3|nr:uncharacterized protein BJ171DRAFT_497198 [Polychytrium aggregatum]KAI9206299.1 hypothetical protein BJ171DRAFT_497198 [Polychytrium aggregatum]